MREEKEELKEEAKEESKEEQQHNSQRKRKLLWLTAALACVVALVVGVRLTLSAFTANDFLKAVAVTGTSQDLFASDVLAPYSTAEKAENPVVRSIIVDTTGSKSSFTFKIYNCLLDDQRVFNDKEVAYTLSVEATNAGDDWGISGSPMEHTFSATKGEIETYTITFDSQYVDKASFKIVAQVDKGTDGNKSPGTSKYCLAARVAPVKRSDVTPASINGSWAEKNSVKGFAAYNYRITVTGEKKRVKLTWNPEQIELDSHFETNHEGMDGHQDAVVDRDKGWAQFDVDPGSEIVTFYKVDNFNPSSWGDIDINVTEAPASN